MKLSQIEFKNEKVIKKIKDKQLELTLKHNLNPKFKYKIDKTPMYKVIETMILDLIEYEKIEIKSND